jgi:acetyl-CoA carboxylase biotin carboxyl carrier protein
MSSVLDLGTRPEPLMDRARVLELLEQLKNSSAAELAVRENDMYVRLRRRTVVSPAEEAPVALTLLPGGNNGESLVAAESAETPLVAVTARLVGFFHRGSRPGEEPLVDVGSQVVEGKTIATVDSLRQATAVTAPLSGTIVEVVAEEGAAVQYGDVLFRMRPAEEGK